MARKKRIKKDVAGQQPLIDITPEKDKEIVACAKLYRNHVQTRVNALAKEKEQKEKLRALLEGANLSRLEGGKIELHVAGLVITMTPRDELIRVKEEDGE